ncbi:MAG: hypothetical protein LBE92_01830 [Chryseobacterium sp.]|jgi:hypothetical protein|uniref:hypothetical protein n=1 Tax=Chryseobacterium sp. TaxID=1871047 RepID=UPI00282A61BC|nr:hypothetical protein [Chryseobacterium sp.]MDR2234838.1 hypothetical protein [Chryseobacterium sp.]
MFKKQNILKSGAILALCFYNTVSAQEFYPLNFRHLFTDEGIESSRLAVLNGTYLTKKGFEAVNDTVYVHPVSKEQVILSTSSTETDNKLTVSYLTESHLTHFRKRLQDKNAWLVKINDNLYEYKAKDVINQFLIDKDTLVDQRKFHQVKFMLTYKKGTRFGISTGNHDFPISTAYPLQNTTWYFTSDYTESRSYSDQNELDLKLTKEKQSHKIEFTDDIHFKVSYTDKTNKPATITGTYDSGANSIAFSIDAEAPKPAAKTRNGIPVKVPEPIPTPGFQDPKELDRIKNTKAYFRFIFSGGYDSTYYPGDDALHLHRTVYKGFPRAERPFSSAPSQP